MTKVVPIRDHHVDLLSRSTRPGRLYHSGGLPKGETTGWPGVDEFYTVGRGQWTVVTGIPGSGKSEWLDALMVNLAEADPAWLFASTRQRISLRSGISSSSSRSGCKPFNRGPTDRMTTTSEYASGAAWVLEHFLWLETDLKSPEALLRCGAVLSRRSQSQARRGAGPVEHAGASARRHERDRLRVPRADRGHAPGPRNRGPAWLVVHPAKILRNQDGTRPVPTPYDLSGSAHWYNKADNIITVHRDQVEGRTSRSTSRRCVSRTWAASGWRCSSTTA